MAILDGRGLVDDGSDNVTVVGNQSVGGSHTVSGLALTGPNAMIPVTVPVGTTAYTFSTPGFFTISPSGSSGQGSFTGSLPSPSLYPGADLLIIDNLATFPWMLTGSIALAGPQNNSSTTVMSSTVGTHLAMTKGSSVGLWSDNVRWMVCAVNGVVTLTP